MRRRTRHSRPDRRPCRYHRSHRDTLSTTRDSPGTTTPRRTPSGGVSRSQDIPKISVADILKINAAQHLAAWCRLLGLYDCDDLKDAEPDTLRYRLLSLPARLVRHARARVLKISRTWPWIILSFRVSRGCDLRRPVVDSVDDGMVAA